MERSFALRLRHSKIMGDNRKVKITIAALLGVTLASHASAQKVVASMFCASVNADQVCTNPIIRGQIRLQDLSSGRIHFWSALDTQEGDNYLHAWVTTDRPIPWAQPFHVHYLERARQAGCTILDLAERGIELWLSIRYGNTEGFHNSQGVVLCSDETSEGYRTSSNLSAAVGTFSVEVLNFNEQVVPGGEEKTLTILP